jgi:hypothetical protein
MRPSYKGLGFVGMSGARLSAILSSKRKRGAGMEKEKEKEKEGE